MLGAKPCEVKYDFYLLDVLNVVSVKLLKEIVDGEKNKSPIKMNANCIHKRMKRKFFTVNSESKTIIVIYEPFKCEYFSEYRLCN